MFAGQVKIVSHSSCRASAILKYFCPLGSDILSAHPASFTHNFVSGMQSFYFSKSKGAMVLQTSNEKIVFWTHKFAAGNH